MNYQNNKIVSFLVFAFVAITLPSNGQTFYGYQGPDIIRAAQLIQNRSFLINPNQLSNDEIDSILNVPVAKKIKLSFADFEMSLAPLQYISVFSSTIPSNFSQGTLVPNVGVQTLFTAGFNLKWKNKITLQFVPEFQRGQNKPFPKYPTNSTDWTEYYHYLNNLDLPAQFGETQLNKYSLGQSSAIFHWKTFDIGLSTANKWWGPASFNPIILGSNAQGFAHGTVSTRRPIKTFIGNIEGEAIVGLLEQSGIYPPETNRISTRYNEFLYKPKKTTNRYLTGLVYTLQPKWVPGLYIGLARTSMMYKDEMNNLGFFSAFEKYIEETGEITLYKLMVPNPNPEEGENSKYAIWIYKGDSISKLEITPSSSINEFRTQAPLICNYLNIDKDVIDLAADLGSLGF